MEDGYLESGDQYVRVRSRSYAARLSPQRPALGTVSRAPSMSYELSLVRARPCVKGAAACIKEALFIFCGSFRVSIRSTRDADSTKRSRLYSSC